MSETIKPAAVRIGRVTLKQRLVTLANAPYTSLVGRNIQPDDDVLVRRGGKSALRFYEDLWRDDTVAACLQKRIAALVGREWSVDPGDDSAEAKAVAEMVQQVLKGSAFDRLVEDMQAALLLGLAVIEAVWTDVGDRLVPDQWAACDPRRFNFIVKEDGSVEPRLLTKGADSNGVPLEERKFIFHRIGGRYGNPWGLGLGHRLFWLVFFKRQGMGFWMTALEKFGQPTVVGKYPEGTSEQQQDVLLDACRAVSSDTGIVVPDGMVVELLEAQRAGSFDSYKTLITYFDEAIAKVILGETLTTSAGDKGSRSLGEVHNDVRLELTKADADLASGTLNAGPVRWIVELNAPGYAGPMPRLWWQVDEEEDLAARAKRDLDIKNLGFRPSEKYIQETYGPEWTTSAPPTPPPEPGGMDAKLLRLAERRAGPAFATPGLKADPRDLADILAEQLDRVAGSVQDAALDQIKALIDGAGSLEEIRDGLAGLFPKLDTPAFARVMGEALVLAELAGRSDLTDGVV